MGARIAALAEVLLVLALGNVIGAAIYPYVVSSAVLDGSASDNSLAFASGLLIFLRLGSAAAIGLLLLYLRTGQTPRAAGLTRNGHSFSYLAKHGLVLGTISSFLVGLLFFIHSIVPLGEGLAAWWTYDETPINSAFLISLLGTSILTPPLTEEILTRGYNRARLVESFGPMAGVVLTGLIFGLSHTRYLVADGMMLLFMCEILLSSILWTYSAQKTGSIIPALIAHSVSNGIASAILFNAWIPFFLLSILLILIRKDVGELLVNMKQDWQIDGEKSNTWQGMGIIFAVLATALISLGQFGRLPTLIGLGVACLAYCVGYAIYQKTMKSESQLRSS